MMINNEVMNDRNNEEMIYYMKLRNEMTIIW